MLGNDVEARVVMGFDKGMIDVIFDFDRMDDFLVQLRNTNSNEITFLEVWD